MPAPVPERDRRSVSTSALVTKKVPDIPSPSLTAFLHQTDTTDSEFLAKFSCSDYVDIATVQWTAHPSFRLRKPVADRPAGSVPSVLTNPPHATCNIPISQLLANCIMALAPGLVVPTPPPPTDANLPYFCKIASLSEAELSCLLPGTDSTRLPRLQRFFTICLDDAVRNMPSVIQTTAANTTLASALQPPSPRLPDPIRYLRRCCPCCSLAGGLCALATAEPDPIRHIRPLPLPLTRRGVARALRRRARSQTVHSSPPPLPLTRRGAVRALHRRARTHTVHPAPLPLPLTRRGAARALRRRARPHQPLLLTGRGAARALRRRVRPHTVPL